MSMQKLLGILLGIVLLAPLPSLADNLEINQQGQETNGDLFIRNDVASIRISVSGTDIQGEAWSESSDSWSTATTIFTDAGDAFEIDDISRAYELDNGTILFANGDDVVSYSAGSGFQHFDAPFSSYKIAVSHNKVNFLQYCSNASTTPQASLWTESGGFGTATDLTDSICTGDVNYMAGKKGALVDYYSGVTYDINSAYAITDTIDLSSLAYVDEDDDWDAQGNNPGSSKKNNGDIVFAFENSLYGYDYSDEVWRSLVTVSSGFTVVGNEDSDGGFELLQTEDGSNIFAFASNDDETEWEIYRWDSTVGWQLEKTYSFTNSAQLIRADSDGSADSLDWAFWIDSNNRLRIYQWTASGGYDKRESRLAACAGPCGFSLDISRGGKVFVTWQESDGSGRITVAAWKPVRDTWDKTELPANASGFVDTHVTIEGRWIVQYQTNSSTYNAIRWTPDSGWSSAAGLQADQIYYDGDKMYSVAQSGNTLVVERYVWSTLTSNLVTSVSAVDTFYDGLSFIYDHTIFLDYLDTSADYVLDDEAL